MGHLVVMDDSEAQFALTAYSCQLWRELAAELPGSVEHEVCGTLWVAADEWEMGEVERKARYYEERGVAVEVIGGKRLEQLEPNLRAGMAGALRVPGDAVIYPPAATHWMSERAGEAGATVWRGVEVRQILEEGAVELAGGAVVEAFVVVNAAGATAGRLTPGLPVRGRKGHLAITDRYPGFARHQLIELGYLKSAHGEEGDSVAFNIQPRKTGQMLVGSSRQYGAEGGEVEPGILGRMLRRAVAYMPGLRLLNVVRVWTGERAATPDKLPLIGPVPGRSSIWLATGHEGLGITTSLGTARLLGERLVGGDPEIPYKPYDPGRFAWVPVAGQTGAGVGAW
jgi:glycine/D-amino acid oxidase-like deaminating enzyme